MTDLMRTLYDYVLTQSESYLAVYPEYRDFCRRAAEKERSLRANLSQEEEQLLEDMLKAARVGLLYAKIPIFYPKTM